METIEILKKKFEDDCYLQLGNLHAKIDLSEIIEACFSAGRLQGISEAEWVVLGTSAWTKETQNFKEVLLDNLATHKEGK